MWLRAGAVRPGPVLIRITPGVHAPFGPVHCDRTRIEVRHVPVPGTPRSPAEEEELKAPGVLSLPTLTALAAAILNADRFPWISAVFTAILVRRFLSGDEQAVTTALEFMNRLNQTA